MKINKVSKKEIEAAKKDEFEAIKYLKAKLLVVQYEINEEAGKKYIKETRNYLDQIAWRRKVYIGLGGKGEDLE